MNDERKTEGQSGGVNIGGGSSISVGGDIVGRDKITAGDDRVLQELAQWESQMNTRIDANPNLSGDDRQDLKDQVSKIKTEAAKGKQADPNRLERLINTLAIMSSDIFDVAIATLVNPLAGIGLALKKIGDKAKLEREGGAH